MMFCNMAVKDSMVALSPVTSRGPWGCDYVVTLRRVDAFTAAKLRPSVGMKDALATSPRRETALVSALTTINDFIHELMDDPTTRFENAPLIAPTYNFLPLCDDQ